MGDIHVRRCGDVDRGQVDRTGDGDRVLQIDRWGDVDRAGGDVHLSGDGDGVAGIAATVHGWGDGCRVSDWGGRGRVVVMVVGICVYKKKKRD